MLIQVRKKYNDWDRTIEGRMRQALRMKHPSRRNCLWQEK